MWPGVSPCTGLHPPGIEAQRSSLKFLRNHFGADMKYPLNKAIANFNKWQHVYFNISSWDSFGHIHVFQPWSGFTRMWIPLVFSNHSTEIGLANPSLATNLRICHHCNFCPSRIGCPMPRTTDAHATRSESGLWWVYVKPYLALREILHKITQNMFGLADEMFYVFNECVFGFSSGNVDFIFLSTPPKTNEYALKIHGWKMIHFLLKW